MKDLQSDEEYLNDLKNEWEALIGLIQNDLKTMIDKNQDILIRYLSYVKLHGFYQLAKTNLKIMSQHFALGRHTGHPIFKSKPKNIKDNPFFKQDEIFCKPFLEEGEFTKKFFEFLLNISSNSDLEENKEEYDIKH